MNWPKPFQIHRSVLGGWYVVVFGRVLFKIRGKIIRLSNAEMMADSVTIIVRDMGDEIEWLPVKWWFK